MCNVCIMFVKYKVTTQETSDVSYSNYGGNGYRPKHTLVCWTVDNGDQSGALEVNFRSS